MLNQIRINGSGISSVGMNMDENNAIGSKDLLFKGTENKKFLFLEKRASSGVADE
jgi:hypothetical protein